MEPLNPNCPIKLDYYLLLKHKYISASQEREDWEAFSEIWKNIFWYNIRGQWRVLLNAGKTLLGLETSLAKASKPKQQIKWRNVFNQWYVKLKNHQKQARKEALTSLDLSKMNFQELLILGKQRWKFYLEQYYHFKTDLISKEIEFEMLLKQLESLFAFNYKLPPTDDFLTELWASMLSLEKLDCRNEKLKSLNPIGQLQELRVLTFSDNPVKDLSALKKFKHIQKIYCIHTGIFNLEAFSTLDSLTHLYCGLNPISDLNPVLNLPNLRVINYRGTKVKSRKLLK